MIDIHCHLLYGVDDGPKTIGESIEMLKYAKSQGIDTIVLTPHYRHGMFHYDKIKTENHLMLLNDEAENLGIRLYLGCEYHVNSHMIEAFDNKKVYSMGSTNYILTEYKDDSDFAYIRSNTIDAISSGYIPIIAHVERYMGMLKKPENAFELQKLGAMIQINADAVIGNDGAHAKRYCDKLLKHHWVDFVASDAHGMTNRPNHLAEAYKHISKKFSPEYADLLFEKNATKMFDRSVYAEIKYMETHPEPEEVVPEFVVKLEDHSLDMTLPPLSQRKGPNLEDIKMDFLD